jgi:hypothetical protein
MVQPYDREIGESRNGKENNSVAVEFGMKAAFGLLRHRDIHACRLPLARVPGIQESYILAVVP